MEAMGCWREDFVYHKGETRPDLARAWEVCVRDEIKADRNDTHALVQRKMTDDPVEAAFQLWSHVI
jgi:hypothetical protein